MTITNTEALSVDDLAQEIRSLAWREMGAGLLAEKLMPFFERALSRRSASTAGGGVKGLESLERFEQFTDGWGDEVLGLKQHPKGEYVKFADVAALSALEPIQTGGEPVAWLLTRETEGMHEELVSLFAITDGDRSLGWKDIPLYTRSSPVSAEVTVTDEAVAKAMDTFTEEFTKIAQAGAFGDNNQGLRSAWRSALTAALATPVSAEVTEPFQARVAQAHVALFHDDPTDVAERRDRFYEEATEAAQSFGMTEAEAHALVAYTFSRPVGAPEKEIGAAALTLASLCVEAGYDMMACAEADLAALVTPEKIAKVRAKRATRHGRGPLPGLDPSINGGR